MMIAEARKWWVTTSWQRRRKKEESRAAWVHRLVDELVLQVLECRASDLWCTIRGPYGEEPYYDGWKLDVATALSDAATRARALWWLARDRARDADDAGYVPVPELLEQLVDDFNDWTGGSGYNHLSRAFYVFKAATCLILNLGLKPKHERDRNGFKHVDSISGVAVWDCRRDYYGEYSGTTLDVGEGWFRNWFYDIGSL